MRQSDAIRETPRAAVWSLIGNTPLVRLGRLEPHAGVEIHAKLESKNPGGSVKDRAAASMILDGLRTGALRPGRTLLDATSGNTGIAYAMLGAALGYPVKLCVPSSVTEERKRLLRVYGADVCGPAPWRDPTERSAWRSSSTPRTRTPTSTRISTIIRPTGARTTRRPVPRSSSKPAGRSPTSSRGWARAGPSWERAGGCARRDPDIRLISVQPDSPLHGLEGLKHMETAIVPGIYDPALADEDVRVETEAAWDMVHRVAREEGLFVGVSGAAALVAAISVAGSLERGLVVTVIPDGGERYLSDRMLMG